MSWEESAARCGLGVVAAVGGCSGALGSGGLAAAGCVAGLGLAAMECQDFVEDAYQEYSDGTPEPETVEEIDGGQCYDPQADNDMNWNIFYSNSVSHLKIDVDSFNAIGGSANGDGRSINYMMAQFLDRSTLKRGGVPSRESRAKAVKLVLNLSKLWLAWEASVRSLKFNNLEHAQLFSSCLNNVRKVVAYHKTLQAIDESLSASSPGNGR